jgi:hypothetical protein
MLNKNTAVEIHTKVNLLRRNSRHRRDVTSAGRPDRNLLGKRKAPSHA